MEDGERGKMTAGFRREELEAPEALEVFPVSVNFDAANAPTLKKRTLKFKSSVLIADVQDMLRDMLREKLQEMAGSDALVLVVEKCFVPMPDQTLGQLYESFGRNGALHITYGIQAVFG